MTDRPRRRRAFGFLGMVVLVGLIEGTVATRRDLTDPVAMQWRYRASTIRSRARHAEVLCLGDSLVKYGVAAPVLGAKLGRSVANQAVLAAPAAASYFALRDAVEAGARPRLVVVSYAPFLLLPGYRLNRAFLPEMAGLGACLDLARTTADPELAGALTLARLVPTIRCRARLRERVGGWITGAARDSSPPPRTRRPDLWLPRGDEAVFDWFYAAAWKPGGEHERYVDRLVTLAREHGATVVWLMPPVSAPIRREWDALGLSARYTRFAASVQTRHPNLVVLDGRAVPVADADLLDPLHLNPRGAERFTTEVAGFLGHLPREPRWIDLAAPSLAPPAPEPLAGPNPPPDRI